MAPLAAICVRGFLAALFAMFFMASIFGSTAEAQEKARIRQAIPPVTRQQMALQEAKARLVTTLYRGNLGNRALFASPRLMPAGTRIASWKRPDQVLVDQNSWFFFVDEQPGANWEHQATYVLVNQKTGQVRRIPATTPPINIVDLEPQNQKAGLQKELLRRNLQSVRRTLIERAVFVHKGRKYAILVSGGAYAADNHSRYWNDLRFIYRTLRGKYNFTDQEIYVFYANGTHLPSGDLDGNGSNDIDYAATRANLFNVLKGVANNIAADGKFLFFATNHGGRTMEGGKDAYLWLWEGWIHDHELAALSKNIKCAEAIYVMGQCYSGGMMDDLLQAQSYPCKNPKVCVMTASRYDEVSYAADTEGDYDEYLYYWTAAVNGKTLGGKQVNADANGDGAVSMVEAHNYARSKDSRAEHPQIGSCESAACIASLHLRPPLFYEFKQKPGPLEKPVWPSPRGSKPDIERVPKK